MMAHGPQICRPQKPRCQECVIKHLCEYFRKRKEAGSI
ncbi:hypothetical protein [Fervidibacter sacchari]